MARPGGRAARAPFGLLGIDEAGRGSVVGPLVVGGFLCDPARAGALGELGVRDSKRLTPARREAVYRRLPTVGRRLSVSLPAPLVDRYVDRGRLIELEVEAFARLVRAARPSEVFVDACDPNAERFGLRVGARAGGAVPVRASHRADEDVPVVSAASIVAKVRRDRAIARLAERIGGSLGTGYPSAVRTVERVRSSLASSGPAPAWIRRSWATVTRLKRELSIRPLERFGP